MKTKQKPRISFDYILFVQYTATFIVFVAGIFAVLLITHHAFMQYHDAYKQGAFRLIEIRNQLNNILSGDGFELWSWYEGPGFDEPLEIFLDPFMLIGALFPVRYLELGFTFAALLRMYTGGLAFLMVGKETGLRNEQNLTGSILYVFSACFIGLALRQSETLITAYMFPLLVLGVERVYKRQRPAVFMLVVAYYMMLSFYYSYMSAIVILVYIGVRYFAYFDRQNIGHFAKQMELFILYGTAGIVMSAATTVFSVFTLTRASTDSNYDVNGVFFAKRFYENLGKMILGTATTADYLDIGLPILIIILLLPAIRNCTRRSTNTIMTIISFIMLMFPFFGNLLNGFGYVTFRWSYMLVFFASWAAAEQLDPDLLRKRGNMILACTGFAIIAAWTYGLYLIDVISLDKEAIVFVLVQLAAGVAILAILFFIRKRDSFDMKAVVCLLAVSLISLSIGWAPDFISNIDNFTRNAAVYKHLQESTLRVSNRIEDVGFYRIDSVDGISRHNDLKYPSNENIWWKSNNLFIYHSRIPSSITQFNLELGNSYGYARRVYTLSNGNRLGLDYLYGVRYFLGNDTKKEGYEDSDNYADYGFEKTKSIDGVTVFKNKYDAGLGFVLNNAMLESEFKKLSRLEKEQALLQVAVIPDDQIDKCGDIEFVTRDRLDLEITDVPFEIKETDGISFEDGSIMADKPDASFVISVEDVPESQLVISFDDLLRNTKDGETGEPYEMYADDGRIRRTVLNQTSRMGVDGLKSHDINIGRVSGRNDIRITLSKKGNYTFSRMYVSAMSLDNYDKYAGECTENCYDVNYYDDDEVKGTVNTDKDGILFISIPAHDNWNIYIDGEKAERIDDMDITFAGAFVPKGKHQIVMRYENAYIRYGCIVSFFGLVLFALILKFNKKLIDNMGLSC